MTQPENIQRLLLQDVYAAGGATFADFDGWWLPAEFGEPLVEHAAIRNTAALVERSHTSRILVTGSGATELLGSVFGEATGALEEGRALRAVALDESGRIRDFVVIARSGADAYLVIGQPGQRAETLARLRRTAGADVRVEDRTETTCLLAVVGPEAARAVSEHLSEGLPEKLESSHCVGFEAMGFRALAIRASDTGEDGFLMMFAPGVARHALDLLKAGGVRPAGEIAQTIARVEACLPAFSPDLVGLTAAEADLAGLASPGGEPNTRLLSALTIEGQDGLHVGEPIVVGTTVAGEVRSSVRSPLVGSLIALGVVGARHSVPGTMLVVDGRPARVTAKPFYRRRG